MPTWPLDVRTWRQYGVGNIFMTLPIANFITMQDDPLRAVGTWVESILKNIAES